MKVKLQCKKLKRGVMLSNTTIEHYIKSIPAIPEVVKRCSDALQSGDMISAADIASEDKALTHYLETIVNKPIFGFADEVKDIRQIFGILGMSKAKQLMYGYYLLLILPKRWEVFDFNSRKFQDLQARLIYNWGKIVKFLQTHESDIISAVSIMPASLIVCEMLFSDINSTVKLLKSSKQLSYEAILQKMTGRTFFDISSVIAQKWDFSQEIVELIAKMGDEDTDKLGKSSLEITYLRLLLIYEMSSPVMVKSGLNDLFELEPIFDDEIIESFYKIIRED